MTELAKGDLRRAIVSLFYWDDKYFLIEGDPTLSKIGTAFFIQNNNDFYAITASHCLNNVEPENIFLAIPTHEMRSLPLSEIIKPKYLDGLHTDTEIRLLKLPLLDTLYQKLGNLPNILAQNIMNTPYMKRQLRILRNSNKRIRNPYVRHHQELLYNYKMKKAKKIIDSSFWKQMKASQEIDIQNKIQQACTPDLQILTLHLIDSSVPVNAECQLLGYPNSNFKIDYDRKSIASQLSVIPCIYKSYCKTTSDSVFEYQTDEDLDGFSGGPIIYDNQVVAVAHSVIKTEKLIKATPFSKQFMQNLSAAQASK